MSEQAGAPSQQAGQGPNDAPGNGADKGDFDYARAYSELRPAYTQATQEAAQYRDRLSEYEALFDALHDQDPDVRAQAAEALGLEFEAGSQEPQRQNTDEEFVDPLEEQLSAALKRVEALEAAREQEATKQQAQQVEELRDEYIGEAITMIEESRSTEGKKFKFSEREEEILGNLAIAMTGDDGVPDVQGAYSALYGNDGVLEINRQRWIETKTGANPAPLGTSIPADQKPRTRAERIAYADERWARLADQQ